MGIKRSMDGKRVSTIHAKGLLYHFNGGIFWALGAAVAPLGILIAKS